ncbi:hypothetical protein AAVH_03302 [Aphelenchoides avenae]|nr:hypothetical protein AAVH_03302 [Aphelenchus avenae]
MGGRLGGYRIVRKSKVIPRLCELTLFADDDMTTVVGSRRILLDAVGDFQASGGDVADFKLMLGQAQWVVATMRATANAATQLSEPIEAIRDLPDALPENAAMDRRFRTLALCSDYTIRCNGGSVTASSLVLLLRSAYFKRLLLHPSSADSQAHSHYLGYPVDVVSPLVTYLHTDTFGLEPTVPLRSVQEMLKLIDELEPVEMRKLKNGIAAYVHRQFETNNSNVHDLALIAAIALQLPFERLAICALKLIANDHYIAFKEQYNAEAANPWRAEVYQVLATEFTNHKLHNAHDEKLLFPNEDGPFQPLVYVDRIRETGFTTRLIMGLE